MHLSVAGATTVHSQGYGCLLLSEFIRRYVASSSLFARLRARSLARDRSISVQLAYSASRAHMLASDRHSLSSTAQAYADDLTTRGASTKHRLFTSTLTLEHPFARSSSLPYIASGLKRPREHLRLATPTLAERRRRRSKKAPPGASRYARGAS